jgi:methyltransferase, FkbM family
MTIFSRNSLKYANYRSRQCSLRSLTNVILLLAVVSSVVLWQRNDSHLISSSSSTTVTTRRTVPHPQQQELDLDHNDHRIIDSTRGSSQQKKKKTKNTATTSSTTAAKTSADRPSSRLVFTSKSCAAAPAAATTEDAKAVQQSLGTAKARKVVVQTNWGPTTSFGLHVYETNDIVSNSIIRRGTWENAKLATFHKLFTDYSKKHNIPLSDLTFVDIGANIGWFTFNLAALGVNVIAFEPMEENIKLIRDSMCLEENLKSGLTDRITLHAHGLGIRNETCIIYSHNINVGDGHVQCVGPNNDENDLNIPNDYSIKGRIPVRRLDDVLDNTDDGRKHIVVLKMDTEGYEANVLQGGEQLFLKGRIPVVVTEFVPEWIRKKATSTAPEMFMEKFYKAGYLPTNKDDTGYMSPEEMLNMTNYDLGRDVTLHSLSFRNSHKFTALDEE